MSDMWSSSLTRAFIELHTDDPDSDQHPPVAVEVLSIVAYQPWRTRHAKLLLYGGYELVVVESYDDVTAAMRSVFQAG